MTHDGSNTEPRRPDCQSPSYAPSPAEGNAGNGGTTGRKPRRCWISGVPRLRRCVPVFPAGTPVRLPVSTRCRCWGEEGLGSGVPSRVVGLAVGPGAPEDARPGPAQDTYGVGVVAAAGPGAPVDVGRPSALAPGVVGEAGERGPEALVAGPPPSDGPGFAALVGDAGEAGLGGELAFGREALAHVAELGEDLRRADAARPREGHDDPPVRQLGDGVLDAAGDPGDLGDEGLQGARERAHEFPLGLALGLAGAAPRGGREPRQQRLGRAAAAVAV